MFRVKEIIWYGAFNSCGHCAANVQRWDATRALPFKFPPQSLQKRPT